MKKLSWYRQLSVSCLVLLAAIAAVGWLAADERVSVKTQRDAHAGSYVVVPVTAVSEFGIDSVAFRLGYPAEWLTPVGVYTTAATRDFDLRFDVEMPGQLLVELSGRVPVFDSNAVAWVLFNNDGAAGEGTPLELFDAVVNGSADATLDHGWLELALGQTTLSLPSDLVDGTGAMVTAPLVADPADGILALDVIIEFDSTVLQFVSALPTPFTTGFGVTPNLIEPGRLLLSLFGVNALSGTGTLINVNFTVVGEAGESTPLDIVLASVNEGTITATLVDGFFTVCDGDDLDDDGFSLCDGDCDDDDGLSFPGNPEVGCDGRDNDCDPGTLDVLDGDDDLFACDVDCNDDNPAINPDATEVCDGEDNDCVNGVDEDAGGAPLTQATACGVGACDGNTGVETCEGGVFGNDTCDPLAGSSAEVCDGEDNDCDAATDEDAGGAPLTQATACGVGACDGNTGVETCEGGVFANDTCDPLAGSSAEVCDGEDNDCDAATDEDAGGAPLTQATACGVGACAGNTGVETCEGGVFANDTCDPLAGSSTEVCDGEDNDCDAATDEDAGGAPLTQATACGVGACEGNTGVETCEGGVFANDTCDPLAGSSAEVCDGSDNDCDSFIDNVPVPSGSVSVDAEESSPSTFSWGAVAGATGYDIVRGNLSGLIGTGGDFSLATDTCLADDAAATSVDDADEPPAAEGFWYMVRPINCGGAGTYDSGGIAQDGQRDLETDLSPDACP